MTDSRLQKLRAIYQEVNKLSRKELQLFAIAHFCLTIATAEESDELLKQVVGNDIQLLCEVLHRTLGKAQLNYEANKS